MSEVRRLPVLVPLLFGRTRSTHHNGSLFDDAASSTNNARRVFPLLDALALPSFCLRLSRSLPQHAPLHATHTLRPFGPSTCIQLLAARCCLGSESPGCVQPTRGAGRPGANECCLFLFSRNRLSCPSLSLARSLQRPL